MLSRILQLGLKRQLYTQTFRSTLKTKWTNLNNHARFNFKRLNSTSANGSTQAPPKKGIKALIQEYGYSALGVYLALSAVDLPLCFLFVHNVGVDQVREYQAQIKAKVKEFLGFEVDKEKLKQEQIDAKTNEKESSGFWSNPLVIEAVLAYALHKSLVFIRVPITASVTPSVVKILRGWGFNIGNNKLRTIASQAKSNISGKVKPNFGTPPTRRQKWYSWFF